MTSRSKFLYSSSAILLAGCAGGVGLLNRSPGSQEQSALVACGESECPSPVPTHYNYTVSQATNNGRTGTAKYNVITSVASSGTDTNGSSLFSGTITSSYNNDNSVNTQHTAAPTYSGAPSSVTAGFTIPGTLPLNGSFNFTDSHGVVHSVSIKTSGSAVTVVDTFTLNGHPWTFTVSSPDGDNTTVSWVTATGNHSFSMQLPQLAFSARGRTNIASAETIHDDFVRFRDGEEVAEDICALMERQATLGLSISAVSSGLGIIAGLTGIGLPAVPFLEGYGALTGVYGGSLAVAHSLFCK